MRRAPRGGWGPLDLPAQGLARERMLDMPNTSRREEYGFSLVEVLTVMTVMTLLSGLLLPALRAARSQAWDGVCQSNLRQLVLAAQSYTGMNNEFFPPAYFRQRVDSKQISYAWDFTTWRDGPEVTVRPGLLWMGRTDAEVHQCPVFKGLSNTTADPYTGYNYNTSYLGRDETVSPRASAKTTDVRRPMETVIFGDGEYAGGANKYMRAPYSNPREASFSDAFRYAGVQGFRHGGATNAAFCDGHVASLREVYTETDFVSKDLLDRHNEEPSTAVKVGFLSPDNRLYDLK